MHLQIARRSRFGERLRLRSCYDVHAMDKVLKIFHTFADADRSDEAYYASLPPQQRVDILLDLVARYRESLGDAAAGFERVYRVTELSRS